jgi:ABC-2 type transport system ATP-binding protein
VAQGTVDEVRVGRHSHAELGTVDRDRAAEVLIGLGCSEVTLVPTGVRAVPDGVPPERIVAALVGAGVGVRSFTVRSASLEDLFVSLTGEGFDVSR